MKACNTMNQSDPDQIHDIESQKYGRVWLSIEFGLRHTTAKLTGFL